MYNDKQRLLSFWKDFHFPKKLIDTFMRVAREDFVLPEHKELAYRDIALPLLEQQTISQPTTVMLMLKYLQVRPTSKVLEIGTGSGYNAALLSRLTTKKVVSIERIQELAQFAKVNLRGYKNVAVIHADGSTGYPQQGPYDRIIITCAMPRILPAWNEQLAERGILVAPVGEIEQEMMMGIKRNGKLHYENKGSFRFVPLLKGKR